MVSNRIGLGGFGVGVDFFGIINYLLVMSEKLNFGTKDKLTKFGGYLLRIMAAILLLFFTVMIFFIILNNVIRPLWNLLWKIL